MSETLSVETLRLRILELQLEILNLREDLNDVEWSLADYQLRLESKLREEQI